MKQIGKRGGKRNDGENEGIKTEKKSDARLREGATQS